MNIAAKRAAFRALHAQGCFVLPNPWDMGSAKLLQHLGFKALASTSSGFAWTTGRADYDVPRDDALAHLSQLCAATDLPVNADFQGGFAAEPEGVAANVLLAVKTGIAGVSIEDRREDGPGLYDKAYATSRIRAARAAIDRSGEDVILVARTEGLLGEEGFTVADAIGRLTAFADAGADCLYAPGVRDKDDIAAMVRAVQPKPVNVLMAGPGLSAAALADLGVRRISVGGALARVAWAAMLKASEQLQQGSFEGLADALSGKFLNGIFAKV